MQNLLTIEQLLSELNTEQLHDVKILISKQIQSNRRHFETAITIGNIDNIQQYIDKVSFDEEYLKSLKNKTVPHINSLHFFLKKPIVGPKFSLTDFDFSESFHLIFKDILNLDNDYSIFYKHYTKEKISFELSDVLFANLFTRLKLNFEYCSDNCFPKYLYLKPFLQKDTKIFKKTLDSFIRNSLSKIDYQENSLFIDELISLGYKDRLFDEAKNEKNYLYLQKIFPMTSGYNDDFMLKGLFIFNFSMVKQSFEHGIPFFKSDDCLSSTEKAHYKNVFSKVFGSKDSLDIQQYIIDNIPDISVGNHIIVKTILHKIEDTHELDSERNNARMALIQSIMHRYNELSQETVLSFQSLLEKRNDSLGKDILTKFLKYNALNNKLSSSDCIIKQKRNKI